MTALELDPTVAAALEAIARLDGTDPSALAGLIVADWLTEQHARYAAVADAISALANGNGHEPAPVAEPDQPAPRVKPKPAPAADKDGRFPCPDCGTTFTTRQGVGGHRAKKHPGAAKANGMSPSERATAGIPRPAAAGRCRLCGKPTAAGKQVDGQDACHRCWTDAGRP